MSSQLINRKDDDHYLGYVQDSSRITFAAALQLEARVDISYQYNTTVTQFCPMGSDSWWAVGNINLLVGGIGMYAKKFALTKTQKGYAKMGNCIKEQVYDIQKRTKLVSRRSVILFVVYLEIARSIMSSQLINRKDDDHYLGYVQDSSRITFAVALQSEARRLDYYCGRVSPGSTSCQKL